MKKHEPKYIEVEGIMRACYDSFLKTGNKAYSDIIALAEAVPAADVVEVRHGRMVIEPDATVMHCNVCGWAYQYYAGLEEEWNYCPNCGALMVNKDD